jgi:hypothetical protein
MAGVELSPGLEVVAFAEGVGLVTGSVLSAGGPGAPLAVAVAPEAIADLSPRSRLLAADIDFGVVHVPAAAVHPHTAQPIEILHRQHGVRDIRHTLPALNHSLALEAYTQAVAQGFVSPDEGPGIQPTPGSTSSFIHVAPVSGANSGPPGASVTFPDSGQQVCLATSGLAAMQAASAMLTGSQ